MNEVTVRFATPEDYDLILDLQKTRYIHNLDIKERRKGFLSVQMTRDEVDQFARDLGIALAFEGGTFLGFFCLSRIKYWLSSPIICGLVTSLGECFAENNVVEPTLETCLFGPVCLSDRARGRNVFQHLYAFTCQAAAREFDFAISFISVNNLPSITAVKAVGEYGTPVVRYSVSGRKYNAYFTPLEQYRPAPVSVPWSNDAIRRDEPTDCSRHPTTTVEDYLS